VRLAQQLYTQNDYHLQRAMWFHRWEGFVFGFVCGGLFAALVALVLTVMR
jgi:hypothetical protein